MRVKVYIFIVVLFLFKDSIAQNTCVNADFSFNNFSNWTGSTGQNSTGTYINSVPGIVPGIPNSPPSSAGRQTIMNLPGTDPNTGNLLSVLPPGGTTSCRLGNELAAACVGGNPQAERLEYSVAVGATNTIFTYQYAVVLQDPGHNLNQQPKFTIYVLDSSGNVVDPVCGIYEVSATGGIPGFHQCNPEPGACRPTDPVVWKDWTTVSVDLSAYIGQTITIQFTTYDCDPGVPGGHFGYAYISCYCGTMELTQECLGNTEFIAAPPGFAQYHWSTGQTTANITIANPVNGDTVTCTMTTVTGCTVKLSTVIFIQPVVIVPPTPVICNGDSIVVTANGNYTYVWSTGQSGPSISVNPTTTTTYTVTGTSISGCSNSAEVVVTVNSLPVSSAGPNEAICLGSTATISAAGSTGTAPLSFLWNNGVNTATQVVAPLVTTTYTVTVTTANGCSSSNQMTVTVNAVPTANAGSDATICFGANTTLNASLSSGMAPLSYHWSNGVNTVSQTVSPAATTTYIVTVTSGNGCTASDQVVITVNPLPIVNAGPDVSVCLGVNTTLNAGGSTGVLPLSYAWNNGVNTPSQIITPAITTTYTVTVTAGNGCTSSDQVVITVNPLPVVNAGPNTAICLGTTATLNAGGSTGVLPLSYSWNNGINSSTQVVSPATTTTYTVTVTAGNGCSATSQVVVTVNPLPAANAGPDAGLCFGTNTILNASASTGVAPLTYNWSNGVCSISQTVSPPATTTYTLTVSSGNGCSSSDQVAITVNPLPVANAGLNTGICFGTSATLNAGASSGVLPLSFNWSNGVAGVSQVVSPITATTYDLTVTGGNGCVSTDQVIITVNPLPVASAGPDVAICNGLATILNANASSGVSPLSFIWSNGVNGASQIVSPSATTAYTVTVISGNACTATDMVIVTVNPLPVANAGPDVSICNGANTMLNASASTGTQPLHYQWSNGINAVSQLVAPITSTNYFLTVTSANGCTATDQALITVKALPIVNAGPDVGVCFGSGTSICANPVAGLPPFTYHWSNGVNLPSQNILPTITTVFTVSMTDANACTAQDNLNVTVYPQPTVSIAATTPENCAQGNGGITIIVAGGTLPYQYRWNTNPNQYTQNIAGIPQGAYIVTVTDNNNCTALAAGVITEIPPPVITSVTGSESCSGNSDGFIAANVTGQSFPFSYLWSNGSNSQVISNLAGGAYDLTVTDAAGCSDTAIFNVGTHPVISLALSHQDAHCGHNDGKAFSNVSGGSGNFTYLWSNFQNTQNLSNVPAGTYTVTVSDGFCTATQSVTLMNLSGPNSIITSNINETCSASNAGALVVAMGGTTPYIYHWNTIPVQTNAALQNVHAGTYIVTVTDANGCISTSSVTLLNSPPPISSVASSVNAACGFPDGAANIGITGGTAPFQFYWNTTPPQATQNITNVVSGTYTVTVTDANGCTSTSTVVISQNAGPLATVASQNEICNNSNGTATVTATGGTGIYTYLWSNGQTSTTLTGLPHGNYSVTVSDGGCSSSATVSVQNTPGPTASFVVHPKVLNLMQGPVTFNDYSTGNIVNWLWNYGDGSPDGSGTYNTHNYPNIGTYIVSLVVTDNNGCMDTMIDTVHVNDIYTFYIPNSFTPNGDGINDVFSPEGINVDPYHFNMYIFDRWGNIVYHTNIWNTAANSCEGWNGTKDNKFGWERAVVDVYVYKIYVKELSGQTHVYYGHVTLVK